MDKMNNLTQYFPNTSLTTEEIREVIRRVLRMEDTKDDIYYFCFVCYRFLGSNLPKGVTCKKCYQIYCPDCAIPFSTHRDGKDISSSKCPQCTTNFDELKKLSYRV